MFDRLQTILRLGILNIARVGFYRLRLKLELHPVQRLDVNPPSCPFFQKPEVLNSNIEARTDWNDQIVRFGWHKTPSSGAPPNWFDNPFSDASPKTDDDWWRIPDFGTGDIKGLWELSRFDWVLAFATKAAKGDQGALDRLNAWLTDWAKKNPPYKGPNWKCGQESSIRVLHLTLAAFILQQSKTPLTGLCELIEIHLKRIAPTLSYALGQQNNHGTSEAAALFIGGAFLRNFSTEANKWHRKGRKFLENRAKTLIESDGSFSQYSVTYHRLMLDTYALAEFWRIYWKQPAFCKTLRQRLTAATHWLEAMVDEHSGDAPIIGANDGAKILQLGEDDYRDFRSSVELAANLFDQRSVYGPGEWQNKLNWLKLSPQAVRPQKVSQSFEDGGYHVLQNETTKVVLRFPKFRFRPSQADALHLDMFHKGQNILRDAGTYSYNADATSWFASSSAHNTISFDGRDQMPRLGRFLFSNWLKSDLIHPVASSAEGLMTASAGYTDPYGCRHERRITLTKEALKCEDIIEGAFVTAELRWRLIHGNWAKNGNMFSLGGASITVEAETTSIIPACLNETLESRYYLQQNPIPEIVLGVKGPSRIITTIELP